MTEFKEISPLELQENAFKLIGKDWMLISAQNQGHVNAMTASWGGVGVMWAKNVAFVVIRPQRYTKEFVDGSEKFSISFFKEEYKKMLNYFGTVSGRDEDKISTANLAMMFDSGVPYYKESKLTLFCKKLYSQQLDEKSFLDRKLIDVWYPKSDYHTLYVAEIEKVLVKAESLN
ncbi:flavin reductase [bacterium]|nr:flavin reductase [bacterium]